MNQDARRVPQVQQINAWRMAVENDALSQDARRVTQVQQINAKHMVVVENDALNQDALLWPTLVANA
jgi:hypothetical protein